MTARRSHTSPTVSPSRTGGDDQPRGNCYNLAAEMWPLPTPFDVLTDGTQGEGPSRKILAATAEVLSERLCGGCWMRPGCWADEHEEPWRLTMRGIPLDRNSKPKVA